MDWTWVTAILTHLTGVTGFPNWLLLFMMAFVSYLGFMTFAMGQQRDKAERQLARWQEVEPEGEGETKQ